MIFVSYWPPKEFIMAGKKQLYLDTISLRWQASDAHCHPELKFGQQSRLPATNPDTLLSSLAAQL